MKKDYSAEKYLTLLAKSAICKNDVCNYQDKVNFSLLRTAAKRHSMLSLLAVVLNNSDCNEKESEMLKNDFVTEELKESYQQVALKKIGKMFYEKAITAVILKGWEIKYLYETPQMRRCGDIDLLIKKEDRLKIKLVLLSLGFICKKFDSNTHDIYALNEFVIVEVHTNFVPKAYINKCRIDENIWDRIIPSENNSGFYKLNKEDFYVFFLAHSYKHYLYGGFGIRTMIDLFVILKNSPKLRESQNVINRLLSNDLKKFKILAENICELLFENETADFDTYSDMTKYIFDSGTYGNSLHKSANEVNADKNSNKNKIKFVLMMLFPKPDVIMQVYPILKNHKILFPYCYFHRIFFRCILNKNKRKKYRQYLVKPYSYLDDEEKLAERLFH